MQNAKKKPISKYVWIVDAGHGGIKDGVYVTAPSKEFFFEDGLWIGEGVTNRAIATKVRKILDSLGIENYPVYNEVFDKSLGDRCRLVNDLVARLGKKCVLVSIHSNAGHGRGFEVFTSKGQDASDVVAEIFCQEIVESFPEYPLRADKITDGDRDKEANFQMIMPKYQKAAAAILLENLFFDTRAEAEVLLSEEGQQRIADYISRAIIKVENEIAL